MRPHRVTSYVNIIPLSSFFLSDLDLEPLIPLRNSDCFKELFSKTVCLALFLVLRKSSS